MISKRRRIEELKLSSATIIGFTCQGIYRIMAENIKFVTMIVSFAFVLLSGCDDRSKDVSTREASVRDVDAAIESVSRQDDVLMIRAAFYDLGGSQDAVLKMIRIIRAAIFSLESNAVEARGARSIVIDIEAPRVSTRSIWTLTIDASRKNDSIVSDQSVEKIFEMVDEIEMRDVGASYAHEYCADEYKRMNTKRFCHLVDGDPAL